MATNYPPFQQNLTSKAGRVDNQAWTQFFIRLAQLIVDLTTGVTGILPIANGGTNSGTALTGASIVVQNGTSIVQGPAGTTTTVLHGNAAGLPTYGAVVLTTDVSGDLPYANLTPATGASLLLGRGSAGGAGDWQEISLGSGLTMTGTSLAASSSATGFAKTFLLMGG